MADPFAPQNPPRNYLDDLIEQAQQDLELERQRQEAIITAEEPDKVLGSINKVEKQIENESPEVQRSVLDKTYSPGYFDRGVRGGNISRPMQEYSPVKNQQEKKQPFSETLYESLASGSARLGHGLATAPGFIYSLASLPQKGLAKIPGLEFMDSGTREMEEFLINNPVATYYKEQADHYREQNTRYDQGITDYIKEGNIVDALGLTVSSIVESIPVTASIMAGGYYGLSPKVMVPIVTAVTGGSKNATLLEEMPEMADDTRILNALVDGLSEGVFEQMGSAGIGRTLKKVRSDLARTIGRKEGDEVLKETIKKTFQDKTSRYIVPKAMNQEGWEEFATTVMQNLNAQLTGEDPNRELFEGAIDSYIVGAGSGGALSAPTAIQVRSQRKQLEQQQQEADELQSRVDAIETEQDVRRLASEMNIKQQQKEGTDFVGKLISKAESESGVTIEREYLDRTLADEIKDEELSDERVQEILAEHGISEDVNPEDLMVVGRTSGGVIRISTAGTTDRMADEFVAVSEEMSEVFYNAEVENRGEEFENEITEERKNYHETTGEADTGESNQEWFSSMAVRFATQGKVHQSIGARLRDVFNRFVAQAKLILRDSFRLRKAIREGKVPESLIQKLKQATDFKTVGKKVKQAKKIKKLKPKNTFRISKNFNFQNLSTVPGYTLSETSDFKAGTKIKSIVRGKDMINTSSNIPPDNAIYELKKINIKKDPIIFGDKTFSSVTRDDFLGDDYDGYQTRTFEDIKQRMEKGGMESMEPLIFDNFYHSDELEMIDGHHRAIIANELGWDEIYAYVRKPDQDSYRLSIAEGMEKYRTKPALRAPSKNEKLSKNQIKSRINRLKRDVIPEIENFAKTNPEEYDEAIEWYFNDIRVAIDVLANENKFVKDHPTLFTAIVAITSNGQKVPGQYNDTADVINHFTENKSFPIVDSFTTGKIKKPIKVLKLNDGRQLGGARPGVIGQSMNRLQYIIDQLGLEGAEAWLLTPKTGIEIHEMAWNSGTYKQGNGMPGISKDRKNTAEDYRGMHIFGRKIGNFGLAFWDLNREAVIDVWMSRWYNRHMGTPFNKDGDLQESPRNTSEWNLISQGVSDLTDEINKRYNKDYTVSQVQAVIWYHEKYYYEKNGINYNKGINYSRSANERAKQKGYFKDTEELVSVSDVKGEEQERSGKDKERVSKEKPSYRINKISSTEDVLQSPSFKKWFKGSKVVDDNGNPLVVYHGTAGNFNIFNTPSYFSDENMVSEFIMEPIEIFNVPPIGENIIPVYLSLQNPKIYTTEKEYDNYVMENPGFAENIKSLKTQGFDGIIYKPDDGGSNYYISFEPTQIKSVFNKGAFDPEDPRISFRITPKNLVTPLAKVYQEQKGDKKSYTKKDFEQDLAKLGYSEDMIKTAKDLFGIIRIKQIETTEPTPIEKELKKLQERQITQSEIKNRIKRAYRLGANEKEKEIIKLQKIITKYARENLPKGLYQKSEVTGLLAKLRDAKRFRELRTAMERIDRVIDNVSKRSALAKFNKVIKKKAKIKKVGGIGRGKVGAEVQDIVDKIREVHKMSPVEVEERLEVITKIIDANNDGEPTDQQSVDINILMQYGGIKNKTPQQIAEATESLDDLITKGRMQIMDEQQAYGERMSVVRQKILDVITGGEGGQTQAGAQKLGLKDEGFFKDLRKKLGDFDNDQQSLEYIFDKLSRFDKDSKPLQSFINEYFMPMIRQARVAEYNGIVEMQKMLQENASRIFGVKGKKLVKLLNENTVNTININHHDGVSREGIKGEFVTSTLTYNQAYKKWMELKDPTLSGTFEKMGWDVPKAITQIEKQLPDKVLEWAEWQLYEFYPMYYARVNETFRKRFYVNMPMNAMYSPISRRVGARADEGDDTLNKSKSPMGSVSSAGSLKGRVSNKEELAWIDGDTTLMKHITEMEHFIHYTDVMRELRSVFMSREISRSIRDFHGDKISRVLNKFMDDIARGGVDRAQQIDWMDWMRANFSRSVIGANPVVFLKQLSSIPAYIADIPASFWTKEFLKLTNPIEFRKMTKIISKSEVLKMRYDKGFDRDMMLALQNIKPGKAITGANFFNNAMYALTKLGDKQAIYLGGYPVYKYYLKQALKAGKSRKEAEQFAMKKFEQATLRSQQAGDVEDLADFQRRGSIAKLFTMFMTSPNQYYRMVAGGYRNLYYGRGSKLENWRKIFVGQILLPSLFTFIGNGFDWETDEQVMSLFLFPFSGLLFWGQGFEFAIRSAYRKAYPMGTVAILDPFAHAGKGLSKLADDKTMDSEKVLMIADQFIEGASKVTGVPYGAVKRTAKGVMKVAKGESEAPVRQIIGFNMPTKKKPKKSKKKKKRKILF